MYSSLFPSFHPLSLFLSGRTPHPQKPLPFRKSPRKSPLGPTLASDFIPPPPPSSHQNLGPVLDGLSIRQSHWHTPRGRGQRRSRGPGGRENLEGGMRLPGKRRNRHERGGDRESSWDSCKGRGRGFAMGSANKVRSRWKLVKSLSVA